MVVNRLRGLERDWRGALVPRVSYRVAPLCPLRECVGDGGGGGDDDYEDGDDGDDDDSGVCGTRNTACEWGS